ncbi:unnamed protein product, partial [Gordionus sp. m RMFG-2023]
WDWHVEKDYLLKDNPENRELKKQIDKKYLPLSKKKLALKRLARRDKNIYQPSRNFTDRWSSQRKEYISEIPPTIKITQDDIGYTIPQNPSISEHELIKIPKINFPNCLQKILERDNYLVIQEDKIPLLCHLNHSTNKINKSFKSDTIKESFPYNSPQNILFIMETYIRAFPKLIASLPNTKIFSNINQADISGDQKSKFMHHHDCNQNILYQIFTTSLIGQAKLKSPQKDLHMCKETLDGLRRCFDYLLTLRLLYAREKEVLTFCHPEEFKSNNQRFKPENINTKLDKQNKYSNKKFKLGESFMDYTSCQITNRIVTALPFPYESLLLPNIYRNQFLNLENLNTHIIASEPSTTNDIKTENTFDSAFIGGITNDIYLDHILPQNFSANLSPTSPSYIFGIVHLLRFLAILPDILNQNNVLLLYPKVFASQIDLFLQYIAQNQQIYMQSYVYVNASQLKDWITKTNLTRLRISQKKNKRISNKLLKNTKMTDESNTTNKILI